MVTPQVEFLGVALESWNTILAVVNTLIVVVGVPFALGSIRAARQQRYWEAYSQFLVDLREASSDRQLLFNQFPKLNDYSEIDPELRSAALRCIDFWNGVASLINHRMLPKYPVMSLCHTSILRSWYVLEPYASWHEKIHDGRYARKVRALAIQAARFHDSRKHQRIHPVTLVSNGVPKEIYRTRQLSGFAGIRQKAKWLLIDKLRRY